MDDDTLVVAGSANPRLGERLAQELGRPLAAREIRRFPDGEAYVRIEDPVAGAHVVIVQSTAPDTQLVELLLLQDAAREAGAARITTVIPYYGYARQDRAFHAGEAVSSRAVARAIETGTDAVVAVDPHKDTILDAFTCTTRTISAVRALADTLDGWGIDAVLAPDAGARDRAELAGDALGLPFDHLEKTRLSPTQVSMQAKDLDVDGKAVAILDDMIASGGTMITAAKQLKDQGATKVYAACTHGVFTGDAVPKLLEGGIDRVLCTDTVERDGCDTVSVAPAIAETLQVVLDA